MSVPIIVRHQLRTLRTWIARAVRSDDDSNSSAVDWLAGRCEPIQVRVASSTYAPRSPDACIVAITRVQGIVNRSSLPKLEGVRPRTLVDALPCWCMPREHNCNASITRPWSQDYIVIMAIGMGMARRSAAPTKEVGTVSVNTAQSQHLKGSLRGPDLPVRDPDRHDHHAPDRRFAFSPPRVQTVRRADGLSVAGYKAPPKHYLSAFARPKHIKMTDNEASSSASAAGALDSTQNVDRNILSPEFDLRLVNCPHFVWAFVVNALPSCGNSPMLAMLLQTQTCHQVGS